MRKALKYIGGGVTGAALVSIFISSTALAEGEEAMEAVTTLAQATNMLWVIIGAILVIFMQAGFALVETGFTQKKNAAHVMTSNFAIFGLGFVGFLFVGFPLAFGGFSTEGYFGAGGAAMDRVRRALRGERAKRSLFSATR